MKLDLLSAAVAAWCDTRRVKILRDGGASAKATLPPLLTQLGEAVGSGSSWRARRSSGGRCPVNLGALDLLDRLRITLADATGGLARRIEGPRFPGGHLWWPVETEATLRRLPHLPWPAGDGDRLAARLDRLADEAACQLAPPDIPAWRAVRDTPCPRCGYRVLIDLDDEGERVRIPVLLATFDGAGQVAHVTCAACWSGWWRNQIPELWDELTVSQYPPGRRLVSHHAGSGGPWLAAVPA